MVSVRIFIEGGGTRQQQALCRKSFKTFFEKAGLQGRLPKVVASGSRSSAYKQFCSALKKKNVDFAILLVDSEAAVPPELTNWSYLKKADRWDKPANTTNAQAHLMVQCMESWFLADIESLKGYFGRGFATRGLPEGSDVEAISKDELLEKIKFAAKKTQKGGYDKGRDSFRIIGELNPDLVYKKSKYAQQLIDVLKQNLVSKSR